MDLGNGLSVGSNIPVAIADFWRDALGTVKSEQLEDANVVLLTITPSDTPYENGGANRPLLNRVQYLHWAITLAAGVSSYESAILLTGGRGAEGPRVRFVGNAQEIYPTGDHLAPAVTLADLHLASTITHAIEAIHQGATLFGPYWRILSGFDAFLSGLRSPRFHIRLHQFVRAIEAFLPPTAVGAAAFTDRATTFLAGPPPAGAAGAVILQQLYRLRNAAEHHRDLSYALDDLPEPDRVLVANRRVRQAETLARVLYRRLLTMPTATREHWMSDASISAFWTRPELERRAIWGEHHAF